MGEFAKRKINEVIQDLNNSQELNISEERKKEMRFIIDQIGEPLIKDKLDQKYKQRFQPLDDQIKELELKLSDLRNKQKSLS
jgi:flagellar capping protein FliD